MKKALLVFLFLFVVSIPLFIFLYFFKNVSNSIDANSKVTTYQQTEALYPLSIETDDYYIDSDFDNTDLYRKKELFIDGYELIISKKEPNNLGVIKNGKLILPIDYQLVELDDVNTDKLVLKANEDYGIFNLETDTWSVFIDYADIQVIGKNRFTATKKFNLLTGLIDGNGKVLIPFEYTGIFGLSNSPNHVKIYQILETHSERGIYDIKEKRFSIPLGKYIEISKIYNSENFEVTLKDYSKKNVDVNGNKI